MLAEVEVGGPKEYPGSVVVGKGDSPPGRTGIPSYGEVVFVGKVGGPVPPPWFASAVGWLLAGTKSVFCKGWQAVNVDINNNNVTRLNAFVTVPLILNFTICSYSLNMTLLPL